MSDQGYEMEYRRLRTQNLRPPTPIDFQSSTSLSIGGPEKSQDSHIKLFPYEANASSDEMHDMTSAAQSWSPRSGLTVFAVGSLLCQTAIVAFAAWLIHKPFIFTKNPFHISVAIYNSTITAIGSFFKAATAVAWMNLGAGYLVKRLCERKMTYQFYDRGLHWARGLVHMQASWSFVISLILFASFNGYAAAFNAAFGMHPVTASHNFNNTVLNISANVDVLLDKGVPVNDVTGNDFEVNLSKLALQYTNFTTDRGVLLTMDEINMSVKNGMVLAPQSAAFTVPRITGFHTDVSLDIVDILNSTYGSNTIHFLASGVRANTTCVMVGQSMKWQSKNLLDLYTSFTFVSPACGLQNRVHDATVEVVYDAYSCNATSTIVTGVVKTNPPNGTLESAMECYTTLWDTFGNGTYRESINAVEASTNFESTPMSRGGMFGVLMYTNIHWVQTMGRAGSPGLLNLVGETPLDSPTLQPKMEAALSYLYAIGGGKIIDWASNKAIFGEISGPKSPFRYRNTSLDILTPAMQIGYGSKGFESIWIGVFVVHFLMALMSATLLVWFPVMPLNPTNPLSMVLLALNSPRTPLLYGTSVGRLPALPFWQDVQGFWWRITGRRENAIVDPEDTYKALQFQLEANGNHLELTTYGERGDHLERWAETHAPTWGKKYV